MCAGSGALRHAGSRWSRVTSSCVLRVSYRAPKGLLSSYASLLVLLLQSRAPNILMVPLNELELKFVSKKDKRGRYGRLERNVCNRCNCFYIRES